MDTLYKITGPNREAVHRPARGRAYVYPEPGKWTRRVGQVVACKSGYHLVNLSGICDWVHPNGILWIAEGDGDSAADGTKTAFTRVRLVEKVGVLSDTVLRLWSADCAERVVHLTAPEGSSEADPRALAAIEAARKFARGEIAQDELDAARAAAWDAAWAAARAAAWAAAWDAARAAARDAARAAAWAAARDAAWDAARAAAWDAAWDAARAAAWAAEKRWQDQRLLELLRGADVGPVGRCGQ